MRIFHISDTHIRNLQFHKEYRQVFKKMNEIIKQKSPDVLVHCGDLFHSKTIMSPEAVELGSDFLSMLSSFEVPVLIIAGNHDGNLMNPNRQDAISPIVKLLNKPNLHFLKKSGEHDFGLKVDGKNVIFNVLSQFDKEHWQSITSKENINIALYHGSINGCQTDTGFKMDFGENDISIFDGFDFAFLGDVHKSNQKLDKDGRIRYVGSTVQQNHGEPDDKGFLLWDIRSKNDFCAKHITIFNPKPFKTIYLNQDGTFDKVNIPPKARLRVITEHNLGAENIKKILDGIAFNFKPESLSFVNKSTDRTIGKEKNFDVVNISDLAIQEKLIKEYLEDFNVDDGMLRKVCLLNKSYHEKLNKTNYYDNIHYQILELTWDNFGKFKEGNTIKFDEFDGIIGIFGKNFLGKSSIIEAILYCLSGGVAKETKKTISLINHEKDYCFTKLKIRIGNRVFTIERKSEKFLKRLHGKETEEAKTIVSFFVEDEVLKTRKQLNGEDVNETNREIQKYFGSLEDFLLTTISAQEEAMVFIKKTSTLRKELLSRFIGVDSFKKKYDFANNDAKQSKALLKKFKETNFDDLIEETQTSLGEVGRKIDEVGNFIEVWRETINKKQEEMVEFNQTFQHFTKFDELVDEQNEAQKRVELLKDERTQLLDFFDQKNNKKNKLKDILESFNIEKIKKDREISGKLELELAKLSADLKEANAEAKHLAKSLLTLKEVPCGDQFPHCKFIKDAHDAKNTIDLVEINRKKLVEELEKKQNEIKLLDLSQIGQKVAEHKKVSTEFEKISKECERNKNEVDKKFNILIETTKDLLEVKRKLRSYRKEGIDEGKKNEVFQKKAEIEKKIKKMNQDIDVWTKELFDLHSKNGSLNEKLKNLKKEKESYEKLKEEVDVFELYLQCAHPNGISYSLIKKSLPILNQELKSILSSKVDFEVFFDGNDDDKLEIFVGRGGKKATPIESCSGAERVISAAAIRLAFLSVSSIPRGNLFVLDEPALALDQESMEAFIQMLDIIKGYFKNVVLISHLDALKDTADAFIDIEVDEKGFSFVRS